MADTEVNTIDQLMDIDPLKLTSIPGAIEQIIAYHRKARANAAAGIKAKKDSGPKVDISEVMAKLTKSDVAAIVPTVRRR